MEVPARFHHVNDWLCFALGVPANCLHLWLVSRHSNSNIGTFRAIFILFSCFDLLYLSVFALTVTVTLADQHGNTCGLVIGALAGLSAPHRFAAYSFWLFNFGFSAYKFAATFFFRYLCICRGKEYKFPHFLAMLTVPLLASVALIVAFVYASTIPTALEEKGLFGGAIEPIFNSSSDGSSLLLSGYMSDKHRIQIFGTVIMVNISVTYATVFICAWLIYRHLMGMAEGHMHAEGYRALNLQLTTSLLLQVVIPMLLEAGPVTIFGLTYVGSLKTVGPIAYLNAFFGWVPVLSPCINMCMIESYRSAIRKRLDLLRLTSSLGMRSSTVNPLGQQTTPPKTLATNVIVAKD